MEGKDMIARLDWEPLQIVQTDALSNRDEVTRKEQSMHQK